MPARQKTQVATILLAGLALAVVLATASPATLPGHHHHAVHAAASADATPRTPAGCYRRSDFTVSLTHTPRPGPNPHRLDFIVTNHITGTRVPWRDLVVMHARRAHILVVDSNAETLVHVHPEDFAPVPREEDGEWGVDVLAPADGGPWVVQVELAVRVPTSVCVEPKKSSMGNQQAQHRMRRRHTMDGDDQGPPAVEIEHEFRMPPVDGRPASPLDAAPLRKQENTAAVHGLRLATGSDAYTLPIPLTGLPATSFPPRHHGSLFQVTTASFPDGRAAILPLFQNQCRTVVFHVVQYAARWHRFVPATDLGPLLAAAAHITAVHASTLHTAHFHGVALALSQVSATDVAHVAAQLDAVAAVASELKPPPPRLAAPPAIAWRRGGSERVQLCRGRVGTRVWMHGAAPASFGPWIGAAVSLPLPGWWRLVVQTRVRGGDMVVAAVWVHVEATPSRKE
ncbi:hypothetical protein GGF32_000008 [Allomyces javanicus]|nr:hypothetical protein GGF32_000008 [Allomyces javanicus]